MEGAMTHIFDLSQTLLAWSFAAGRAGNVWGNQATLTQFFEKALTDGGPWSGVYGADEHAPAANYMVDGFLSSMGDMLLGQDWRITWGPCVFKDLLENCLANGMFVAHSPSQNIYVVAVSATNFISLLATAEEDFDNRPENMVNFPVRLDGFNPIPHRDGNNPSRPQLTGGTATGINILCAHMRDARRHDLITYLKSVEKPAGTKLIFAGHSLAGALAPSLALQLLDQLEGAGWSQADIQVFATAGPQPGNKQFSDLWIEKFASAMARPLNNENSFRQLNNVYWNIFDFVPYAWTNLHGTEYSDWTPYDRNLPERMATKLGLCIDQACVEAHRLYEEHQAFGVECRLSKLRDFPFVGKWPVPYWDEHGQAQSYPQPPASITYAQMQQAKGMAHMGQYLLHAGIDPLTIPPAVRLIA